MHPLGTSHCHTRLQSHGLLDSTDTVPEFRCHLSYCSSGGPTLDPTSMIMIVYIQAENGRPVHRLESDHRLAVDRNLYQLVPEEQTSVNELLSPKLNALKKALAYGNY